MQNSFCKSLSNAVSFRIPGDKNLLTFSPCCFFDTYQPFHLEHFKRTKASYSKATDFLKDCSKCKLKEQTQETSLRISSNSNIPDNLGDEIYKLEIVLDTTCNAACIQCGPMHSSLWRKEVSGLKKIVHIQPEYQIDQKIEEIEQVVDFNKVKIFHFWGGEPLLTDTHLKILNKIKDPSDVRLNYSTNVSIFPDKDILNLWSRFKRVNLRLSIDAIEDKFYYIRYPLSWNKIERNIELFQQHISPNIILHINCCVSPLNVLYIKDFETYIYKKFSGIHINYIKAEGMLDISKTPLSLRHAVWNTLSNDHDVSNILRTVPVEDYHEMMYYLETWDFQRKLDWKIIFPELVEHFI